MFIGSSTGLVLASLIGAVAGGSLSTVVPADWLQLMASLGFLVIGLKLLWPILSGAESVPASDD